MTDSNTPPLARTRSLYDFYLQVDNSSLSNTPQGRQMIRDCIPELHHYSGPVDVWFNLNSEAGRLRLPECGLKITEEGLKEHPNNVDLLCDQLSDYYGFFRDAEKAKVVWDKLSSMKSSKRYWRYWVHGATYHAKILLDRDAALNLLEQGLLHVSSDHINNIIRGYRQVLIDAPPSAITSIREERGKQEVESFEKMETLYKWAISLGVEEGHSLAVGLAQLYQEKAGQRATENKDSVDPVDYLQEALKYLDYAERMFISRGSNNPIWDIYLPKTRILMGLHRYSDALKIFRSLPKSVIEKDISITVQMTLAAEMLGEPLYRTEANEANKQLSISEMAGQVSVLEMIKENPQKFFSELKSIAQGNENIANALIQIIMHIQSSQDNEEK